MFNRRKILELKKAMALDFHQQAIDSLTPDRGYSFPTENVREFIANNFEKKRIVVKKDK